MTSLERQLRSSQRSLKRSEKTNRQLMRQMKKTEERLETMSKLQQLIAERQLSELDGGSAASSTQHDHHSNDSLPSRPSQ